MKQRKLEEKANKGSDQSFYIIISEINLQWNDAKNVIFEEGDIIGDNLSQKKEKKGLLGRMKSSIFDTWEFKMTLFEHTKYNKIMIKILVFVVFNLQSFQGSKYRSK